MTQNTCIRLLADQDQINRCKDEMNTHGNKIMQLSMVLGLAGNEVRLRILYLLNQEKELCVCDLSDILGMSISSISQHLRKLKDGQIVDIRKDGQTYYYFIKNDAKSVLNSFISIINSNENFSKKEVLF